MEDHKSSSIAEDHSFSKPVKFEWKTPVTGQTPIPAVESENWPSLAEAINPENKKQQKPAEGHGSTPQSPSTPPVRDNARVPPGSYSGVRRRNKGRQSTVPHSSDHKFTFQPHWGHPPMQAKPPGPWDRTSADRGFWPPPQGYPVHRPPWPLLYPRCNADIWNPNEYFGNFPNGNGNHLQAPFGGFIHPWHNQQAFDPRYGVNFPRPNMPMPPFRQPSPFVNPTPWLRNGPDFYGPPPMFGTPRAHPEPARFFPEHIPHPPNHGIWMQSSDQLSLKIRIVKQIEYYFSNENLPLDYYLRKLMDKHGWVEIWKIAGFNRVRNMTKDIPFILEALLSSKLVEVQGNKIRRRDDWSKWILDSAAPTKESQIPAGVVEDKTVLDLKNDPSCEDTTQKCFSEVPLTDMDTLVMMVARLSLEDNSEKDTFETKMVARVSLDDNSENMQSTDDDSAENIPDLIGNGQSVRWF